MSLLKVKKFMMNVVILGCGATDAVTISSRGGRGGRQMSLRGVAVHSSGGNESGQTGVWMKAFVGVQVGRKRWNMI